MKNITIEFEGRDEGATFFALYAGLKMYSDLKAKQKRGINEFSIAGAEAYSILEDLKESHPKECAEAKKEYETKVKNLGLFDVIKAEGELCKHNYEGVYRGEEFQGNQCTECEEWENLC